MSEHTVTTTLGREREVSGLTWELLEYATIAEQQTIEAIYATLANVANVEPYPTLGDDIPDETRIALLSMTGAWVQLRSILGELRNYAD